MASSIVLRRLAAASSAAKPPSASLLPRFFHANADMAGHSDDERSDDVLRFRRFAFPITPVVLYLFPPTRSLSHVRNRMDGTMEDHSLTDSREVGAGPIRGLDVKDSEEALCLRIDMPGLGKDDVKLTVEQTVLNIKGEAAKESEEETPRRFSQRIELDENEYELDMIEAELKNGVLKITVPRVKEEERKDVREVRID